MLTVFAGWATLFCPSRARTALCAGSRGSWSSWTCATRTPTQRCCTASSTRSATSGSCASPWTSSRRSWPWGTRWGRHTCGTLTWTTPQPAGARC
uniref:Putative secreted protein n=1 Tax=Ixodes ricinus TaxID=34613 RepID=A0A6B0UD04_IXORI